MERYVRNRIYISDQDQAKIKDFRVLLAGVGMGSNIAETLLRLGFETMTLIDDSLVERSDLNFQNYTEEDLGLPKAEALKRRLLSINSKAQISAINTPINHENISEIILGHDVAINCLDFRSDIPFVFDRLCAEQGIYVLHPYNVGFAGIVMVVSPNGERLESLLPKGKFPQEFEKYAVRHITDYFNYWARPKVWIEEIMYTHEKEGQLLSPSRLSIASSLVSGMCASILVRIVRNEFIKTFPKFYYYTEHDDLN